MDLWRPIVTKGELLHRCVEVRIVIELSFGVVSGVGPGIHVLDGSPRASRGRVCFWVTGIRQRNGGNIMARINIGSIVNTPCLPNGEDLQWRTSAPVTYFWRI